MKKMTSKERIQATIKYEKTDHLPMCFDGICHGLVKFINELYPNKYQRALFYLEQELDTAIVITPPVFSQGSLDVKEWREDPSYESYLIFYSTKAVCFKLSED